MIKKNYILKRVFNYWKIFLMNVQFILFIFTYSVENKFLMYKLKNTKELLDNIASDSGEYFFI